MLFYTLGQSHIFIAMLVAGIAVGLFYDILRLIRYALHAGRALSTALDLLFGAGSAALVTVFMVRANYAELRLYVLLGALCGAVIYAFTLSPVIIFLYLHIKNGIIYLNALLSKSTLLKKILK